MSEEKELIVDNGVEVETTPDEEPMVVDTTKSLKEMLMGDDENDEIDG